MNLTSLVVNCTQICKDSYKPIDFAHSFSNLILPLSINFIFLFLYMFIDELEIKYLHTENKYSGIVLDVLFMFNIFWLILAIGFSFI